MRVHDVMGMSSTAAHGPIPRDICALVAHPDQDTSEVATILRLAGLCSMPVVQNGRIVGTVVARELVRLLGRDDEDIARDIIHRLAAHRGLAEWRVAVHGGKVVLDGDDRDAVAGHMVELIAGAVLGVVGVRFSDRPTVPPRRRRAARPPAAGTALAR